MINPIIFNAKSPDDAREGLLFMQETVELSKVSEDQEGKIVYFSMNGSSAHFKAGPAQFGPQLNNGYKVHGEVLIAEPLEGCQTFTNGYAMKNKIVFVLRGQCMFIDKVRQAQAFGAVGVIVGDYDNAESVQRPATLFSMSGDGKDDVIIPSVFILAVDAEKIKDLVSEVTLSGSLQDVSSQEQETAVKDEKVLESSDGKLLINQARTELAKNQEKSNEVLTKGGISIESTEESNYIGKGEVFEVKFEDGENFNLVHTEKDGSSILTPIQKSNDKLWLQFLSLLKCSIETVLQYQNPGSSLDMKSTRLTANEVETLSRFSLINDLDDRMKSFDRADLALHVKAAFKSYKGLNAGLNAELTDQIVDTVASLNPKLNWPSEYTDYFVRVLQSLKDSSVSVTGGGLSNIFVDCYISSVDNSNNFKEEMLRFLDQNKHHSRLNEL
ncbi:hypothetical protein QYM36_005736 [Artemia franciscana]|uniref:PA domain-containing protein n=1 Tax=Artemia franciscana TaxID=6661 RepID=A0AA88IC65_ARTSF|nr:hypothetical protein QYM36_005736 [Artemia franciscana]